MAEVRGMNYGVYVPDHGVAFAVRVNKNRYADAAFGWTAPTSGMAFGQRGIKLRHVEGVSATSGRRASAIVPDVASDLWTGTATTFVENTDAETVDTYTVTGYVGEKMTIPR